MEYERLWKIYDGAIQELNDPETVDPADMGEILAEMATKIMDMDPSEAPAEVRTFFEDWLQMDDAIMGEHSGDKEKAELDSPQEKARLHVEGHRKTMKDLEILRDWLTEKSPKSIPPTIIFSMLYIYNQMLFVNRMCVDRQLFGQELPDEHHHHEEEPGEEGEDPGEEEEEDDNEELT